MAKEIKNEDRYALYEHAHHDLWWAKAQQWNVANWALLLMAGEVAVARTLIPEHCLTFRTTWLYWFLNLAIPIAATWYLSKLHKDIVHNRKVYRELEEQTGIETLREQLRAKGLQAADKKTDHTRGMEILFVMGGVFAIAAAFATSFIEGSLRNAIVIGAVVAAANTGILLSRRLTTA